MANLHVVDGVSRDWVMGWKAAYVAVTSDLRTLRFRSVVMGGKTYGFDSSAECMVYKASHVAPSDHCKCGFNAWDEYEVALRYLRFYQSLQMNFAYRYNPSHDFRLSVVLLSVGMYGSVVEGTLDAGAGWQQWGYRAARQRVGEVFFDGDCIAPACHEPGRYICASASGRYSGEDLYPLRLYCTVHAMSADYILQPSGLALHSGVDVYRNLPFE